MNKLNIRTKLFIAFLCACMISVAAVVLIFRYSFNSAFLSYLDQQQESQLRNIEEKLLDYYQHHKTWEKVRDDPRAFLRVFFEREGRQRRRQQREQNEQNNQVQENRPPRTGNSRLFRRMVLLDQQRVRVIGRTQQTNSFSEYPLTLNDQIIGYLAVYPNDRLIDRIDQAFADRLNRLLWLAAIIALLVTALFSYPLARQLVKPIQQLRLSTARLTQGAYGHTLTIKRHDELGFLVNDFNQLSERLQQNEQSRQQWIMDIAHELRTPLAILRGEIEAIQDGINQADDKTIHSLHQEVIHLGHLVDDLYNLSMSDNGSLSYQKTSLNLSTTLNEVANQYGTSLKEKQIELYTTGLDKQYPILGDQQRLLQLFHNLFKNTLRYTDAPGQLQIILNQQPKHVTILFQDSAPGAPDTSLPHLFERLYRVDSSRNRATGGTGIGLSICYNIVTAHQGTITAHHSPLGGLEIRIELPLDV